MGSNRTPGGRLCVVRLGRTDYEEALKWQLDFVEWRRNCATGDTLLITEHEPVVTVGRAAEPEEAPEPQELARHGVAICAAGRGGKATYHGPGQLIGYPIIDLKERGRDLHQYIGALEAGLLMALAGMGVAGQVRAGHRGVWIGERKIASIGIAVRGWVTYHGFALNLDGDLTPFGLIEPCGMPGLEMTSVARETGQEVDWNSAQEGVVKALVQELAYDRYEWRAPDEGGVAEALGGP